MSANNDLRQRRDAKVIPHLEQYAPVWIIDDTTMPDEDAIQFQAVFQHPIYGWINRRYRYDSFNNVLYHKGQTLLSEEQAIAITETEPYINTAVTDIPNSYGG
jgi:hypothetical protein